MLDKKEKEVLPWDLEKHWEILQQSLAGTAAALLVNLGGPNHPDVAQERHRLLPLPQSEGELDLLRQELVEAARNNTVRLETDFDLMMRQDTVFNALRCLLRPAVDRREGTVTGYVPFIDHDEHMTLMAAIRVEFARQDPDLERPAGAPGGRRR